jgi:hypothetical protein
MEPDLPPAIDDKLDLIHVHLNDACEQICLVLGLIEDPNAKGFLKSAELLIAYAWAGLNYKLKEE